MADTIDTLAAGGPATLRWRGVHAAKLGPFPFAVRVAARAYSNHHLGATGSSAWMRLFYDGDLAGESAGANDPIALRVSYEVGLLAGNSAAFRIDLGNQGSTIEDFGFEFTLSPL